MDCRGCARIQGRETDGRRDDYTQLFGVLVRPHERERQSAILTKGGRSHFFGVLSRPDAPVRLAPQGTGCFGMGRLFSHAWSSIPG